MAWLGLLALCLTYLPLAAGNGFISPAYQDTGTGPYGTVEVWELGSSQLVAFQTDYDAYSIELWQQNLQKASARNASSRVYSQSVGQDKAQSFRWTVQTYDITLSDSPVFFLWLRGPSDSDASQTSAFFNITIPQESTTTSTTSSIATTATTATSSTSTQESSSTASTTTPTTTATPAPSDTSSSLSGGAVAGIAVGASVVGLAGLVWAGIFCWTRRRKQNPGVTQVEQVGNWPPNQLDNKPQHPPSYYQHPSPPPPESNHVYRPVPVEMGPPSVPAELGDNYR
ncbi:hypothetical protein PFICI_00701 [Pestalotiopsis fici W106-1]|uniref:Mid2 domain-containing protein n=1 Tax=Pestalotiopsis fici (strain W106-1 / CGMCC3.15140) TaxID=1229662 RepID=W3XLC6_PESFW|nr:uncharacterized protein PFICI_00701 [Pestalotiopsis fici W106-1]ETS86873.1 hypothetical protein PFICI_00701 [Pestalotiopsis fici W106-1]